MERYQETAFRCETKPMDLQASNPLLDALRLKTAWVNSRRLREQEAQGAFRVEE